MFVPLFQLQTIAVLWKLISALQTFPNSFGHVKVNYRIWFDLHFLFTDMAPFYDELCKEFEWKSDAALLKKMKAANEAKLKELDVAIEDAEKNLGESEIRENMLTKAEYLCSIGDKVCVFCL